MTFQQMWLTLHHDLRDGLRAARGVVARAHVAAGVGDGDGPEMAQ